MTLLDRFLVMLCRRSWWAQQHLSFTVDLGLVRVPVYGAMGLGNLSYRSDQFLAVLRPALEMRPEGTVVDIGANVGRFLLNLLALDRDRSYVGVEPLLPAAAYIRRLIAANGLNRHSILAVALSDRAGLGRIRFGSEADASATMSDSSRPPSMYRGQQQVVTSTADVFFADVGSIALIKLDVEASELNVLTGMTATLGSHRPPLLVEVMPYAYLLDGTYDRSYFGALSPSEASSVAHARREHALAMSAFFRQRDYVFFECSRDGKTRPTVTLDRGASKDRETDFLILPAETAESFVELMTRGERKRAQGSAQAGPHDSHS